jgi:hypothetical protein
MRHRLEVVEDVHAPQPAAWLIAAASTTHGTLVSRATWSVTAPATPNEAASIARGSTPLALRNSRIIGARFVVLERDELADFDPPRPLRRPREESEQRLGSADTSPPAASGHYLLLTFPAVCLILTSMSSSAPDDDALRRQFYGARDIRSLYPRVTDNHLRYLEKWGLIRPRRTPPPSASIPSATCRRSSSSPRSSIATSR